MFESWHWVCHVSCLIEAYGACILSALEAQRKGLEELAEDKVEHVKKESKAKYESELITEVRIATLLLHWGVLASLTA